MKLSVEPVSESSEELLTSHNDLIFLVNLCLGFYLS